MSGPNAKFEGEKIAEIITRYSNDYDPNEPVSMEVVQEAVETITVLDRIYREWRDRESGVDACSRNARQTLKREFLKASKALEGIIGIPVSVFEVLEPHGFEKFQDEARTFLRFLSVASGDAKQIPTVDWYILSVRESLSDAIGTRALSYHDPANGSYCGALFESLRALFSQQEYTDAALERAVRTAQKRSGQDFIARLKPAP